MIDSVSVVIGSTAGTVREPDKSNVITEVEKSKRSLSAETWTGWIGGAERRGTRDKEESKRYR